jgi:Fe/S biogenesis protein NfuA
MFGSKRQQQIETLQWKIKSLEDQNRQLREDIDKALQVLRRQVVAVKSGAGTSDEAILQGLAFDVLSGKDLETFLQKNPNTIMLDVRTLPEFDGGHIPHAVNIPVDQLTFRLSEVGKDPNQPVVTYCASGARAQVAGQVLAEKGFQRVYMLRGGVGAYPGKLEVSERPVARPVDHGKLETDNPELAGKVQALLDGEINPGVAAHGGRVSLVAVKDQKVNLQFGGGCHGCGQVDATLKLGITQRIQDVIGNAVKEVIDVTDHSTGENPYFQPGANAY